MSNWRLIKTAPLDGSEILLLTTIGVTQARFHPGEWHDYLEGREYDGAVWVCCDDQWQIEIEECSHNPAEWHHGIATHWQPMLERPETAQADTALRDAAETK